MSTTDLPEWLTEGASVVPWSHSTPGTPRTVKKILKTQIVCNDGTRWKRRDLTEVGVTRDGWHERPKLVSADSPMVAAYHESMRRYRAARKLEAATTAWRRNGTTTTEQADALVDAIVCMAPYLGITVTVDADQCTYRDSDDRPCLLPATHTIEGRWHAGLGWSASLGATAHTPAENPED